MAASPYFDSAGMQIDESKAALLKAVATGGTAGKQAFDAAQQQAAQAKQEAVARAAERSALYGIGGNDQTFLGAYDARANQGAVNRAGFESGLAQTQASGESYLEKARGAIPVLQGININKAADEETKIKLAIQAAKDKAQAAAEKEARAEQERLDRENRTEARAIARENRASARSDAKAAAKPKKDPTADLLLAAGRLQNKSPLAKARLDANTNILGVVNQNQDARMGRLAGQDMGYSPLQIETALSPGRLNTYEKAIQLPPSPDVKWLTSNVRGMDTTKAQQALAAPEMTWARDFINDTLAAVQLDEDGLISSAPQGFEGMVGQKPVDAFNSWVRAQKGNLTMKAALEKYYGPTVSGLFG